jgi:alpha-mannosidase
MNPVLGADIAMPKHRQAPLERFLLVLCLALTGMGRVRAQQPAASIPLKTEAYIVPFSHLDLFWAGTREECLARGNRIISRATQIGKGHPEFRFFLESDNFVDNYVESHRGSPELEDLKRLVQRGQIQIAPNWTDIFLNQPDGEVLTRNLLYGKRYARAVFGVDTPVFHPGDIPGFAPQLPQVLSQSHVPYMVMTRIGPTDRSLFNWQSPDGSRVLVWNAVHGYAWGIHLKLHEPLTEADLSTAQRELNEVQATTPGPVYIPWGLDLWTPTDKLVSNVNELNRAFPAARFALATPQEFFRVAREAKNIPSFSGEIPLAWPHVIDSIVHLWQLAVPATNTLENAEKFATVNYALGYADYPQRELESLWKALIESMDHNHDGQGGDIGDREKMEDSQRVIMQGGEILRKALRNIAERVELPVSNSAPIVVFNALGWKRDDVVRAHLTLYGDISPAAIGDYRKGTKLVDEAGRSVPFHIEQTSDNISRALELVFVAQGVPPLGYRTYFLVPAEPTESLAPGSTISLDRANDSKEPRRPLGKDAIENRHYRVTVDKATGGVSIFDKQLGRDVASDLEIVGIEERGTNNVQREITTGRVIPMSINTTEVEENNPVRTVFKITGWLADVPVVQRLILYPGLKRLDIENSLQWNEPRFLNIEQLIPIPRNADVYYGVPFGAASPKDILPGSGPRAEDEIQKSAWEKYRTIQSWVFAGTSEWGLTVAADHQLLKIDDGVIAANMIRGQRYTSVRIVRGDEVSSIHFPAQGSYVFRYSLSSGVGDWKAARSYQNGPSFNNPLIAVSEIDEISEKSLPPTYSFVSVSKPNLVLSAFKKSEADESLVVRFYEIAGTDTDDAVIVVGKSPEFRETNLLEEDLAKGADQKRIHFKPFEIKTVRLRPGSYRSPK